MDDLWGSAGGLKNVSDGSAERYFQETELNVAGTQELQVGDSCSSWEGMQPSIQKIGN